MSDTLSLLTMNDVCELLQVRRKWLYRRVESGDFPALKLGNMLRFRRSDVEEWLDQQGR